MSKSLLFTYLSLTRSHFSSDSDTRLSTALYQAWSNDARIYKSPALSKLLFLLLNRLNNPSVVSLLHEVVPNIIPQLVLQKKFDVIVEALKLSIYVLLQLAFSLTILIRITDVDVDINQVFLREICSRIKNSNGNEKDRFVAQPSFVSKIGEHLRGNDATTRRHASTIIDLLSRGSESRSGRIMSEGVGWDLSWIAL